MKKLLEETSYLCVWERQGEIICNFVIYTKTLKRHDSREKYLEKSWNFALTKEGEPCVKIVQVCQLQVSCPFNVADDAMLLYRTVPLNTCLN